MSVTFELIKSVIENLNVRLILIDVLYLVNLYNYLKARMLRSVALEHFVEFRAQISCGSYDFE